MMVRSDGKSLGGSGVNVLVIVVAVLVFFSGLNGVYSSGILNLQHRFASRGKSVADLKVYKAHDSRRHGRILANIDTPIGGTADPTVAGLYYAQLGLGVPSKNYYVQVDTGSDILWVNCVPCRRCPKSSGLGVRLTLYNPDESSTGSAISCDNQFCDLASQVQGTQECKYSQPCAYGVEYGDGSSTSGYYVQDTLQYNQVTGNFKTRPANATVIFGCGAQQTGELESTDQALDGILGFGQSNTSILSQLAFQGKVRKMFAHCLDGEKGGGILAIGHVVQTNLKMTPLVQNQPHYNVNMTKMDVGGIQLEVDSTVFETGDKKGTIIDSGTTLAYISEPAFKPLINAIMSAKPDLQYAMQDGTYCFVYDGSVDDAFPDVTLYFEGDLTMNVYPHDYLLSSDNSWCIGWQDSGAQSKDNMYMTILGDLVLKNKLVVYDLENQTIGWVNYNCSSSIKMQDENGAVQYIGAHQLSHGIILRIGNFPFLLISLVAMVFLQLSHC
eukprot:Gb_09898 [translate_table: standard]